MASEAPESAQFDSPARLFIHRIVNKLVKRKKRANPNTFADAPEQCFQRNRTNRNATGVAEQPPEAAAGLKPLAGAEIEELRCQRLRHSQSTDAICDKVF